MGDWEFYCALCAAPFFSSVEEVLESEHNITYSDHLFSWLDTLQVIGENLNVGTLSCCYISGNGHADSYGIACCTPSNDPNCPSADGGSQKFSVATYYDYGDDQEGAIPVHRKCLQIFRQVLAREMGTEVEVNADILFGVMRQRRKSEGLRCLDIDYLELDKNKGEQYFVFENELMPFVLDPVNIPAMEEYVADLPFIRHSSNTDNATEAPSSKFRDPFSELPSEILIEILSILPIASFTSLMKASPASRRVELAVSFWRKRVETHIPWSWEVLARAAQTKELYDWEKIHDDLEGFSKPDRLKGEELPLGFANRRRIYSICEKLVYRYIQLGSKLQDDLPTGDVAEMSHKIRCMNFVGISNPLVPDFDPNIKYMLSQWSDIAYERKTLEISWNSSGFLAGIALTIRGVRSAVGGDVKACISTDTLVIEGGDWLDGFLFFMTSPEPKVTGVMIRTLRSLPVTFGTATGAGLRLMSVDDGNVFVGLKAVVTKDIITRLGILECPLPSSVELPSLPKADAITRRMVWKEPLLPVSVHALDFHVGYSNHGVKATESGQIMQPLIFGASEEQLSTFTGLAVSADFLGLFAYHSNSEASFIGVSKNDLKYFPVDGPGGERIVKVSLGIGSTPVGLRVLTNRGRQGIFGMLREGSCTVYDCTAPPSNNIIVGVYGSFERRPRGHVYFTSFSALYSSSQNLPAIPAASEPWDPAPPPAHWRSELPVYGSGEHYAITYLDLTKPITKISGLLAAPDEFHIVELGGFIVTYADGSESCSVGTPTSLWTGIQDAMAVSAIERHKNMSSGFGIADQGLTSHVSVAEAVEQNRDGACWDLGPSGDVIRSITVWAGKYLNGIQFHTVDGRASPMWGKCGQRESAVITTGASAATREPDILTHAHAVGVKFYLDSYRDHFNAADARPVGLQVFSAGV